MIWDSDMPNTTDLDSSLFFFFIGWLFLVFLLLLCIWDSTRYCPKVFLLTLLLMRLLHASRWLSRKKNKKAKKVNIAPSYLYNYFDNEIGFFSRLCFFKIVRLSIKIHFLWLLRLLQIVQGASHGKGYLGHK